MRKLLIALVLCFQCVTRGMAQQPTLPPPQKPPEQKPSSPSEEPIDIDVVKITTNLVQIDAVVTDRNGRRITDLQPDEVVILEDGKPQKITNFSYINIPGLAEAVKTPSKEAVPAPGPTPPRRLRPDEIQRTIALVIDDLRLSFESVHFMRQAVKKFIDQQMQPNDLVAIIRTAGGMGVLQQFTSDKRQLYGAIEEVKWHPRPGNRSSTFGPLSNPEMSIAEGSGESGEQKDLTPIFEDMFAVGTLGALNYVVRGLGDLPGRKSVILFSDGLQIFSQLEPTGNSRVLSSLRLLIDLANRASVVINTMDARGLQPLGLGASDSTRQMSIQQIEEHLTRRRSNFFESQAGLDYLAASTGGQSIRNTNDLTGGIRRILEDQAGYYLIGYRPDDSTFESTKGGAKFHRVSLKINRPGKYNVRTRSGFYGVSDETVKARKETGGQQLVAALLSPFSSSGVQVRLTSLFANDPEVGSAMRSFLHIKASDLTFTKQEDASYKAVFDIIAVTFGENGTIVEKFAHQHTISANAATYDKIMRHGFTYVTTVPIKKPGAYQFRTALQDQATGRVGSATQFIEVPDVKKNRLTTSGLLINGMSLDHYEKLLYETGAPRIGDDPAKDSDPQANTSVRQFHTGTAMVYGLTIYNARIDKTTGKPNLTLQARLFRDGELVFAGKEVPFDLGYQTDLKRLGAGGGIQLGTTMVPGEYVLEIVVTDVLVKGKHRTAAQWMDFEIVL